ncbi:MAG: type II toxin-antitoxin system RelE/ParE family toxin [Xanthobacteraceae bacterium]|nr:type II toxin-antitoxin system RelE/ParE family toxin [Xanthobacteraceae bacterium]MBY0611675.1 type II toxin-antitoxin system RelE/ParE family toxin [Beijerinckiaceae bacterium]
MSRVVFSPKAQADIDVIWNQSVQNWDIIQAQRYIRHIQAAVETLAAYPALGVACDFIRDGYRRHPAGSHVIYFRQIENGIAVIRILHKRVDVNQPF